MIASYLIIAGVVLIVLGFAGLTVRIVAALCGCRKSAQKADAAPEGG